MSTVRVFLIRHGATTLSSEDRFAGDERVEIARLHSPLPRASRLVCPPGYCAAAEAGPSPIFEVPWQRLRDYWNEIAAGKRMLRYNGLVSMPSVVSSR